MPLQRRSTGKPERQRTQAEIDRDKAEVARKLGDMAPHQRLWLFQTIIGMGLLVESSPVELAVPVLRTLAGKRGIQAGPALGSLLSFLALQVYSTRIAREVLAEGAAEEDDADSPLDRWLGRSLFSAAEFLPAFGAVLPVTVVLRNRSPLWGLLLWPLVRLAAVTVLAAEASRLKKFAEADATETEADVD